MDTPMNTSHKAAAAILGFCLIASALVCSYAFYRVRALDNTLEVTGSTRKKITSDAVKWVSGFTRTVPETDLKGGYAQMARDTAAVKKFFKDSGLDEAMLDVSPVQLDQDYRNYQSNEPKYYNLRQTVTVRSDDVAKITALAKDVQKLTDTGIIFATQFLEYSYSKLPELRVELLGEAVKDAKTRAANIAESGGQHVGSMKSASVGVVQVLAAGSNDVSDYGTYDTASIEKEVMVTVRASFNLK
jgi:hypothetical protein